MPQLCIVLKQCCKTVLQNSAQLCQWPVSQKNLNPLVTLSMEKTMVTLVVSELQSISRLKIFRETDPRCLRFKPSQLIYMYIHTTRCPYQLQIYYILTLLATTVSIGLANTFYTSSWTHFFYCVLWKLCEPLDHNMEHNGSGHLQKHLVFSLYEDLPAA